MVFTTIIFDFDGVLCQDYFYANLKTLHPEVSEFIESDIFGTRSSIPDKWMRAELTSNDVNKYISDHTGIDFIKLTNLFIESVRVMHLDNRLLNLAKTFISRGGSAALVTNNMDVFNTVTIQHHQLDKVFPVIVNSFDYKILKHEQGGKLFDLAMEKLGRCDYNHALLIDDSKKARTVFENKGGWSYPYETYEQFEPWMNDRLLSIPALSR